MERVWFQGSLVSLGFAAVLGGWVVTSDGDWATSWPAVVTYVLLMVAVACFLGGLQARRKAEEPNPSVRDSSAGRDIIVAGRDMHTHNYSITASPASPRPSSVGPGRTSSATGAPSPIRERIARDLRAGAVQLKTIPEGQLPERMRGWMDEHMPSVRAFVQEKHGHAIKGGSVVSISDLVRLVETPGRDQAEIVEARDRVLFLLEQMAREMVGP